MLLVKKMALVLAGFMSVGFAITTSGCASGGYHLTRMYAGWINKQDLIIRILLYIFLGGLFIFTILGDVIIFNTMDFWQGKLSQGTYEFKDAQKIFVVKHSLDGELHKTEITVKKLDGTKVQDVSLIETKNHEVEYFIDGKLKAKFENFQSIPKVSLFDSNGKLLKEDSLPIFADKKLAFKN